MEEIVEETNGSPDLGIGIQSGGRENHVGALDMILSSTALNADPKVLSTISLCFSMVNGPSVITCSGLVRFTHSSYIRQFVRQLITTRNFGGKVMGSRLRSLGRSAHSTM